jgi:starch-binding outer membrane protein, SusD/RagB family
LAQCLQFITNECDSAAKNLVVTYATGDLGHATKGAAMALKSRVLLFAASDLFNTSSWAGSYANPELISLSGSNRTARWDSAARAAKRVLDLTGTGYSLVTAANYVGLFKTFNSSEIILTRRNTGTNTFERASYPVGYDLGNSGTTPSQNLVDDFEVKVDATTAVPFNWNNPAHAANPFSPAGTLGRDPRLAYNVLLNNTTFKGRPVECWTGGLDGPGKPLATKTGYYLFKYIDPNVDLLLNTTSVHSWILIRLAEIYLNYAEAMNEAYGPYVTGPAPLTLTAQQAINSIRTRATMPTIPGGLTQSQMRDIIRHERRVEFAFEDHRLWDVRRWMLGTTYFNIPLRGLRITKNADASFSYQVINVENRVFEPKMYFYPIPQTDLNIAKGWVQNPLW